MESFIEFEIKQGTKIIVNLSAIQHISKNDNYERLWIYPNNCFDLKIGEYDRIKEELELRSKSQHPSNDSLSKLLEKGISIRLPGPRYGL